MFLEFLYFPGELNLVQFNSNFLYSGMPLLLKSIWLDIDTASSAFVGLIFLTYNFFQLYVCGGGALYPLAIDVSILKSVRLEYFFLLSNSHFLLTGGFS